MREVMQKALSVMNARKEVKVSERRRRTEPARPKPAASEGWDMSPEEALKATMVSGYK